MDLHAIACAFMTERQTGIRHTEEGRGREDRRGDWWGVTTNHGMLGVTKKPVEEAKYRALGGSPAETSISAQ